MTLPRAYRRAGLKTDIFDASDVARCRMYRGWSETIHGVLKNAHEGIANARLIVPVTSLMVMGYLAPVVLAGYQLVRPDSTRATVIAVLAATISYLPRVMAAARFDRAWLATALFPVSILLFVVLQWIAFLRRLLGAKPSWRGRTLCLGHRLGLLPMPLPTPALTICDAVKSYGELQALRGISLELYPGELLGFLGPNGAGKTTLIRCLAGRSQLDSGTLQYGPGDTSTESLRLRARRRSPSMRT